MIVANKVILIHKMKANNLKEILMMIKVNKE